MIRRSVELATEQAIWFACQGCQPWQVLEAMGFAHRDGSVFVSWHEVIDVMADQWRRHCSDNPKSAFRTVAASGPRCQQCKTHHPTVSKLNRICKPCQVEAAEINAAMAEGF